MKNSHKNRLEKLRASLLIMLLFTVVFSACEKENPSYPENRQELKLVFSAEPEFQTGTEYIPIKETTRAQTNKIWMYNEYRYIILEEMPDGDYIIVATEHALFDKDRHKSTAIEVVSGKTYSNVVTSLRPGKYKIVIFTNPTFLDFNAELIPGGKIPAPGKPQDKKYAVKYQEAFSYKLLPIDVFYVQEQFVIEKKNNLDTSNPNIINLKLSRRTSKFRIIVQETDPGNSGIPMFSSLFYKKNEASVKSQLERQDGKPFPWGLDVWGQLWYNPAPDPLENNGHRYIHCFTYQDNRTEASVYDQLDYYIPNHLLFYGANYFFSEPQKSFAVSTGEIDFSFNNFVPHAVYTGRHDFVLENNKITGITLKLTDQTDPVNDSYLMEPVYESPGKLLDPALLFEGNYEHDYDW